MDRVRRAIELLYTRVCTVIEYGGLWHTSGGCFELVEGVGLIWPKWAVFHLVI